MWGIHSVKTEHSFGSGSLEFLDCSGFLRAASGRETLSLDCATTETPPLPIEHTAARKTRALWSLYCGFGRTSGTLAAVGRVIHFTVSSKDMSIYCSLSFTPLISLIFIESHNACLPARMDGVRPPPDKFGCCFEFCVLRSCTHTKLAQLVDSRSFRPELCVDRLLFPY